MVSEYIEEKDGYLHGDIRQPLRDHKAGRLVFFTVSGSI